MSEASDVQRAAAASEAALAPYAILGTEAEAAYDQLAQLASDLCEAPVALITLFEQRRQWFKAKVGFDGDETMLGDALCANALTVEDVLVIPDLTDDSRTCDNNLVRGGPQVRFYAGAPLRAPDGTFLGTLCVIDLAPRPAGLTPAQVRGLRSLADQVMALFELRRLLRERDAAIAAGTVERARLASSEAHWRGLFEGMREGFMVAEIVRDAAGAVNDWRHLEVNPAFLRVVGLTEAQVIGRTIRQIAPAIPQGWIDFIGRVIVDDRPATFNQAIGDGRRHYEGRVFPIGGDQFAVIFLDVTERIAAERRREALIAIGDQLRDRESIEEMTAETARIVGETMRVTRAGYGRLGADAGTVDMEPDWSPTVPSVAGTHRFADYGDLLNPLLAGEPLVIEDVWTDPRTAADPKPMLALHVGALINMPVRERGGTVGVFFVHQDTPRAWTPDELMFLRDAADRVEVAVTRLGDEARRIIHAQELSHRLKNTLAIVQAIASQTLKPVTDREAVRAFDRRLTALATAHDVLLAQDWAAAALIDVARSVLDAAGQDGNVHLSGPPVELGPRAVLSTSLLLHELATNAVKYGALSVPAGTVDIRWRIGDENNRPELILEWVERGGPPAAEPSHRGFGSRLIAMGLIGTGGVDLRYEPTGLAATISAPLAELTQD